jgi:hypothetical protein
MSDPTVVDFLMMWHNKLAKIAPILGLVKIIHVMFSNGITYIRLETNTASRQISVKW